MEGYEFIKFLAFFFMTPFSSKIHLKKLYVCIGIQRDWGLHRSSPQEQEEERELSCLLYTYLYIIVFLVIKWVFPRKTLKENNCAQIHQSSMDRCQVPSSYQGRTFNQIWNLYFNFPTHFAAGAPDPQGDCPQHAFCRGQDAPLGTVSQPNFGRPSTLWPGSQTYLFYWLWSTWSQSWWCWLFNVYLRQEKRIPSSKLFMSHVHYFKEHLRIRISVFKNEYLLPWLAGWLSWSTVLYTKRLQVRSPFRALTEGHWSMFPSHGCFSLSLSLLSKIKHILGWVSKKKISIFFLTTITGDSRDAKIIQNVALALRNYLGQKPSGVEW